MRIREVLDGTMAGVHLPGQTLKQNAKGLTDLKGAHRILPPDLSKLPVCCCNASSRSLSLLPVASMSRLRV